MTDKDPAAQELARKRWEGKSEKEKRKTASHAATKRWENATEKERAGLGKRLAAARAAKRAPEKKKTK